jgi:hypothetical protein
MPKQQAWSATPGQLVLLFVLSVLAAPVEYLAHEGAHYLAARGFGVPASLHFDQVDLPGVERLSDVQRLVIVAAGPAIDWIVGLVGVVFVVARFTPMRLVLAIWIARLRSSCLGCWVPTSHTSGLAEACKVPMR